LGAAVLLLAGRSELGSLAPCADVQLHVRVHAERAVPCLDPLARHRLHTVVRALSALRRGGP